MLRQDEMTVQERNHHASKSRQRAAGLSLVSNLLLSGLKLWVGLQTGSVAILAEGINSSTDLLATALTYLAIRRAGQPPDAKHPYGHGKFESLAGMVEAIAILAAGAYVVYEAVCDLRTPHPTTSGWVGVGVMALSTILNYFLSRTVLRIARETQSVALNAEGQHIWSDVLTSLGVLVALLVSRFLKVPHIQPVVAILVSVLIFKAGATVSRFALAPLLDTALPEDEMVIIHDLLKADPEVMGWHNIRTRRSGPTRLIDMHVMLPDDMTFVEAHRRAEALEDAIVDALPGHTDVIVHAEPFLDEEEHQQAHHPNHSRTVK